MIAKAIFKLYKCSYVRQEEIFLFILTGEACIDDGKNKFIDCKEQNIDEDIRRIFDDGIKEVI